MAKDKTERMTALQFQHFQKFGKIVAHSVLLKHKQDADRFLKQEAEKSVEVPSESLKKTLSTISKEYVFEIDPFSAPRMSSSDKWKTGKDKRPVVVKYHDNKDYLKFLTKKQNYTVKPVLKIEFHVQMPKSWTKKKRNALRNMPHQQKPDIDNFIKAFLDTLCKEDKFVWNVHALKFWSDDGFIKVFE